ncbi:MAG TPA: hypothetical protein VLH39_01735 [Magnetospirillaceae bacterium]|nr:hypothetical protein [Magnetospirillaceae bacterium]
MNLLPFIRNDFRLLWRHGFAIAYLVVALVYAAVLSALPREWADLVLPVLAWSDAALFCFFFAGTSVCLDLAQRTFRALFVSPLPPWAYFLVKAANLSVLSFGMAAAVSLSSRGFEFRPLPLAICVLAGGAPSALIGAAVALRLRTVNRFLVGSIPAFLVLSLPVLRYAADPWLPSWVSALARWTPTEGALLWARAAFTSVPGGELAAGATAALVWTAAASTLILGPAARAARGD